MGRRSRSTSAACWRSSCSTPARSSQRPADRAHLGESPPPTAATALQGYVSLRKVIEPARPPGTAPTVIVTAPPGYVMRLERGRLDLDRFEALVTRGRNELSAGDARAAADAFAEALALWRGPPLANVRDELFATDAIRRLEELRVAAVEDHLEAQLALGRHGKRFRSSRRWSRRIRREDVHAEAVAVFARDLGTRRIAVLGDGGYGETQAFHFARAARRLGIRVVLARRRRPDARSYRRLADAAAGARPDAVFLSGLLDFNGGRLVKDLRRRLPAATELIGNDGFPPIARPFAAAAGGAARGMYVSTSELPLERLPREGRHFVTRFAAAQAGRPVGPPSFYAAQAADVLLDAIAASDGSRVSVVAALRRARVARGLIGSFRFDAAGDVTSAPVTVLRARRAGGSPAVALPR